MFQFDEKNTFCISLESNPTRWERMENRFKQIKISVTRWPAVTNDLIDNFHYSLKQGEKGCAQSHINIWRYIQSNPTIEYALILEDDACFDKKWREKLDMFQEQIIDPNWHAIFLNASEPMRPTNIWKQANEQYLTGGYIISKRGINKIFEIFQHQYNSSDWMTSTLQQSNHCYCYFPWLIIQEGKDSTIGSGYDADAEKVKRCLNEADYSIDNYI
jgi:hypothetical protein